MYLAKTSAGMQQELIYDSGGATKCWPQQPCQAGYKSGTGRGNIDHIRWDMFLLVYTVYSLTERHLHSNISVGISLF